MSVPEMDKKDQIAVLKEWQTGVRVVGVAEMRTPVLRHWVEHLKDNGWEGDKRPLGEGMWWEREKRQVGRVGMELNMLWHGTESVGHKMCQSCTRMLHRDLIMVRDWWNIKFCTSFVFLWFCAFLDSFGDHYVKSNLSQIRSTISGFRIGSY